MALLPDYNDEYCGFFPYSRIAPLNSTLDLVKMPIVECEEELKKAILEPRNRAVKFVLENGIIRERKNFLKRRRKT
jgi:hypothetical protein